MNVTGSILHGVSTPSFGRNVVVTSCLGVIDHGELRLSPSQEKVNDMVRRQVALVNERMRSETKRSPESDVTPNKASMGELLSEAYDRCAHVSAEHSKTFYLGTLLLPPEQRKAALAIALWCRRADELVDGHNAVLVTEKDLDEWEGRLEDIFQGRPYDLFDVALSDTVAKFPIHIQPFKDMIEGMRMDQRKSRYENFDELYLYSYNVAGTVGLMTLPVLGIARNSRVSTESVYNSAIALGIANQLTNILRDVGEDVRSRGRIYLPQDELARAGLSDDDIFAGRVTDKWRNFMKKQIKRARLFYDEAEMGIQGMDESTRWAVWASLVLYRKILDEIEGNDYDNFTKKASVSKFKKLAGLPVAFAKSMFGPLGMRSLPFKV